MVLKEDQERANAIAAEESIIEKSQLDPAHFKPLYEKYFKRVFLFVHRRVGDRNTASDVTSQIFLKALLNIKKYESRGLPFSAWLYRIALNECNSFFRKLKRTRYVSLETSGVHDLADDVGGEHREELLARLPEALRRLSYDELQLIEFRYFERRPFKEVADILDITEANAKIRVYRVLDIIKKMLGPKPA